MQTESAVVGLRVLWCGRRTCVCGCSCEGATRGGAEKGDDTEDTAVKDGARFDRRRDAIMPAASRSGLEYSSGSLTATSH